MTQQRPAFHPSPITLQGDKITLRPLSPDDAAQFYRAGNYPELWQWVKPYHCLSLNAAQDWIAQSLAEQQSGQHVPFVIIDNQSQTLIGSTRYCSIRKEHRGIEIGFTFITPEFQRSYVNSQAKFLLLQHAFEQLGAIRVALQTHEKNHQSRNAILRIGASFEGILRNQRILSDGSLRSSAMFSITELEWPQIKQTLQVSSEKY